MSILDKLQSNENIYASGSRWFNKKYPSVTINDETDYDFYCDDSEENEDFLSGIGMIKTDWSELSYRDDLAVAVYKDEIGKYEVVIRRHIKLYKAAVELISEEYYKKYLHKSSPEFVGDRARIHSHFNMLFEIAEIELCTGYQDFDPDAVMAMTLDDEKITVQFCAPAP